MESQIWKERLWMNTDTYSLKHKLQVSSCTGEQKERKQWEKMGLFWGVKVLLSQQKKGTCFWERRNREQGKEELQWERSGMAVSARGEEETNKNKNSAQWYE